MGRLATALLVVAVASAAACATVTPGSDAARTTSSRSVGPDAEDAQQAVDRCAAFNASQQNISAEEHVRRYGCPPCPCACVDGRITCAPCERCDPQLDPGPQQLPPPQDD